jgi:hypothetical protein
MQWFTMYKDDVAELQTKLAPKVSTIAILLLTQITDSLARAETDRDSITRQVASKFSEQRTLLAEMDSKTGSILAHQTSLIQTNTELLTETQAQRQDLSDLNVKANDLRSRAVIVTCICWAKMPNHSICKRTQKVLERQASSTLMATLDMQKETSEIKHATSAILSQTHSTPGIDLPVIRFRDAFNEVRTLPDDLSRQWNTFQLLVSVAFRGRQELHRVEQG